MFSKTTAFFLCALVAAVAASYNDVFNYGQGFQKTINFRPFSGGYKPYVAVGASAENQESENYPQGYYYPYNYGYGYNYGRAAYPQYWWRQSYQSQGPYNPQYIRDYYYPQQYQYQGEYYYPEGEYQSYDRVARDVVEKNKKVVNAEKRETDADQIANAYAGMAGYNGIYSLPQYYPNTYGQQYGQQYNGQSGYSYPYGYNSAYYGRSPYPFYQRNYYNLMNAYPGNYGGNYLVGQYPYYRTPQIAGTVY